MSAILNFPVVSGNNNGFTMLPFGGGGFVTGGDFSVDGNRSVHATDVGGAYIKDIGVDTQWRPLFTSLSLPSADYDPKPSTAGSDGDGCYDVKIAPSDKDCLVAGYNGYIYRCTNASAGAALSWTRCNLANKRMFANTSSVPFRCWQQKIAIKPTDSLTFLVGTWGDGQYYTQDGGNSFTSVGIAAGTQINSLDPPHLVAVDPGNSNYWFISRHGTGIYRASAGVNSAFTLVGSGPTSAVAMQVTPSGVLWVLAYENTLWKLPRGSSTWTQISLAALSGFTAGMFAVDPVNELMVVVMDATGPIGISTDGGSTWLGGGLIRDSSFSNTGILHVATSVPWLGGFSQGFFPGRLQFRPGQTRDLYLFHGTGVSHSTVPTSFGATTWADDTLGNEELGVLCGLSIPGNAKPLFGFADKGIARITNFDAPRAIPFFIDGGAINLKINHCSSMDYSPDNSNYLVAICGSDQQISGYSTDGGKTWAPFAAQHPDGVVFGGQIICTGGSGATAKIIWIPANNAKAVRSADGGASWSYINMGGSSGGITNWINSMWTRRYPAASDKQTPGVASIVVNNSNQSISAGVFRTPDHGTNWTRTLTGVIDGSTGADSAQFWECKLKYIDGKAGQLLYCGGQGFPDFNSKLKYLADDTTGSWATVGAGVIDNVHQFDCGVGYSGTTFPAVYLNGKVNGVSGIYRSKDWFATNPELLSRFAANNPFYIQTLVADKNKQGRVFVGFNSGGAAYGNF